MKMLVHVIDPETERRDGEETGAGSAREEFVEVKANFVLTSLDSRSVYDRVVELTIRSEPTFRDPHRRELDAPYLNTQSLRRTPARDIDCMNGYSASHLLSRPLVIGLPGPGR